RSLTDEFKIMKTKRKEATYSRKQFMQQAGSAILGGSLLSTFGLPFAAAANTVPKRDALPFLKSLHDASSRIAADPIAIPKPITRRHAETIHVELEVEEVMGEIEDGTTFHYMTFGGQVP